MDPRSARIDANAGQLHLVHPMDFVFVSPSLFDGEGLKYRRLESLGSELSSQLDIARRAVCGCGSSVVRCVDRTFRSEENAQEINLHCNV
jgi:hypothetical protein